jgi:hypothetical protein
MGRAACAMTSTVSQRQAAFRARRRAEGLEEVRGIWAPKALHKQIKQSAKQIAEPAAPKCPPGA